MKKFILIIALAVIGLGVYYTGAYTYFIEQKVNEEMPHSDTGNANTAKEPRTIKQGAFVDADFIHKGSGQAKILEYPDSKKILRFENFETINGPDLYVYLAKTDSPSGDLDNLGGYLDLGRLKGNIGNQNYDLPANLDISRYNSAIIWCKKFGVLFPYSILK